MWKYVKLCSCNSPMAEIIDRCSCKQNIRLVVYHLSENHVECATVPENEVRQLSLGDTARTIMNDSRHNHAILAYDLGSNEVYKIEDVPELPVASAVLLCVVTELLNGCVQPRENQYGAPVAARRPQMPTPSSNVARGANGRFVRQEPSFEREPEREISRPTRVLNNGTPLSGHRFRLGKH
jgi:hypothetical protein